MQVDQLQTLVAVLDAGTFDAAASRLHVTASAVSQRIRALEQSAGRVLVRRTTPITLTAAGDIVLRYARQIELLEADASSALQLESMDGGAARVSIAVNADSLSTWFLGALVGLGPQLGAAFEIHREDQERTATLLRAGVVMAAVTATADAVQGCSTHPLGVMRYHAVCSAEFRARYLPADDALAALRSAPIVQFDRNDDLQDAFLRRNSPSGSAGPRHLIPTSDDFARAVKQGFGWGMLPEQQCASELEAGTLVDLAPSQVTDVPLYWQRWNLDSSLLDGVTDAVVETARTALQPFVHR